MGDQIQTSVKVSSITNGSDDPSTRSFLSLPNITVDSDMINLKPLFRTVIWSTHLRFFSSAMASLVRICILLCVGEHHKKLIGVRWKTDISAAKYADVLFVKNKADGENDLATYCNREKIRHILFENFVTVLPVVQAIVSKERAIDDFVEMQREPAPLSAVSSG